VILFAVAGADEGCERCRAVAGYERLVKTQNVVILLFNSDRLTLTPRAPVCRNNVVSEHAAALLALCGNAIIAAAAVSATCANTVFKSVFRNHRLPLTRSPQLTHPYRELLPPAAVRFTLQAML
jgi:hypothetical protein